MSSRQLAQRLVEVEGAFMRRLEPRLAAAEGPRGELRAMLEVLAGDCDISTWIEVWSRVPRQSELIEVRQRLDDEFRLTFERIVRAGQASGDFGGVPASEAAMSLMAIVDGFGIQATLRDPRFTPGYMLDAFVDAAELLLDADLSATTA